MSVCSRRKCREHMMILIIRIIKTAVLNLEIFVFYSVINRGIS